jgi:hypothetical protein
VYRRIALLVTVLVAVAGISGAASTQAAKTKTHAKSFKLGLYDEAQTLYGDPDVTFAQLDQLNSKLVRTNLYWGGRFGVANTKPAKGADPEDAAYRWDIYDRLVKHANANRIEVVFSIWSTPRWASGSKDVRRPPKSFADLQRFANAAAKRYNGRTLDPEGNPYGRVSLWLAWNEPNNPSFLWPQFVKVRGKWRAESARNYAKICNAIYNGVKAASRSNKIACGVTAPRGNNIPGRARPSIPPVAFLRAAKGFGMKRFDAYAHHPYFTGGESRQPGKAPPKTKRDTSQAIELGNIDTLIREVTKLYGKKRIWITEYGYQTNPPDRAFGVSYKQQAAYMRQAVAIAKKHPRIDMMLWFLLRDDSRLAGWQSGLMRSSGAKKPSYNTFRALAR